MSEFIVGITREDVNAAMGYDGVEYGLDPEHMERVEKYLRIAWPYLLEQSVGDIISTVVQETEEEA